MIRWPSLAACLAAFLAGCAVTPEPAQFPEQLRSTHGFVRATLPQGTARPEALKLRNVQGGSELALRAHPIHGPGSFGLWLPEGEYEVPQLLRADGQKYKSIRVERGRITDLGAVVNLQLGAYEFFTVAMDHPEARADLKAALGDLQPHLRGTEPLAWSTPTLPKVQTITAPLTGLGLVADLLMQYQRHVNKPPLQKQLKDAKSVEEAYRLALTAVPPQTDEPGIDSAGTLYFGAELGQIRTRKRSGEWANVDTGTLHAITAVEVDGNRLLAGTSDGTIRVSDDGGAVWRRLVTVDATSAVVDIDRVGDRWIVITASTVPLPMAPHVHNVKRWKVYGATTSTLADLKSLREAKSEDPVTVVWGMSVRGQPGDNSSYYLNGLTEVAKLNLATMQWTTLNPPQSGVSRLSVGRDGRTLSAFLGKGVFSKLNVSTDGGETWRPFDTPPYPGYDVHFESPSDGHAARISTGAFSITFEFMKYDPVTGRWVKTHEAPAGCSRLLLDADNRQRFCVTSGGSVLDHAGNQWKVEFAAD